MEFIIQKSLYIGKLYLKENDADNHLYLNAEANVYILLILEANSSVESCLLSHI